jgi:gamma-glutamyl-gamma-aminobutyrate hydrolase PuuD
MNNPLIGILGHSHTGKYQPGFGQNSKYMQFARQFGDVVIIDPTCQTVLPLDLLILPGGKDVNPLNYTDIVDPSVTLIDYDYEMFYKNMYHNYLQRVVDGNMAMYGVCAGFQWLNVMHGGTLTQDYPFENSAWDKRWEEVDKLSPVMNNFPNDFDKTVITHNWTTNSIHHQGIFEHNLSNEFKVLAINKPARDYKNMTPNIEFMIHKDLNIAGEQSHPEERFNPVVAIELINTLIKRVKNNEEN